MKTRASIIECVCRPHCRFYRPGEKEELSCRGYDFFCERLGDDQAAEVLAGFKNLLPPDRFDHDPRIEERLCSDCPFRLQDCDFMSGEPIKDAVPCGGYVLMARLLAACPETEAWLEKN